MTDVTIIGGGINGLVAAVWLARKKYYVLLLERHDIVGGGATTRLSPRGFQHPTLSHSIGPVCADVMRALRLDRARLEFIRPDPVLTTLGRSGEAISFHHDPVITATSIERTSPHDASAWRPFVQTVQRLASVLTALNRQPPPSIDGPTAADIWHLLKVGRLTRTLGRRDLARLSRYVPMAVADLVGEWFTHDLMQAAVAARGVFGHAAGPWSAGTGGLLLQRVAEDPMPVGAGVTVKGGPGALAAALAKMATAAGVTIRTGASVARVLTKHNAACGVALESGEQIPSHVVVGAVSPRLLFGSLVDQGDLPPTFRQRVHQIRARGVTAKINWSLDGRPDFPGLHGDEVPLRGRLLMAPSVDDLERGYDAVKYGRMSDTPWLECSLPTVVDESLSPAGQHVMSVYVHYVPHQPAVTAADVRARALAVLSAHAPRLASQIVEEEVLTPADLETRWGYSGGHIFHGEGTLDQWWVSRPLLGWAHSYGSPIEGLFLAGAGAHPGGALTGQSGLNAARVISVALGKRRR